MIRNKKGFTLVELLAVIVILAIILVIAVPQMMKTIDSAREGAFSASEMRTYLRETILRKIEAVIGTNTIKTTRVISSYESGKDANYSSDDNLYLLSPQEVYGDSFTDSYYSSNGTSRQLEYYGPTLGIGVTESSYGGAIKYLRGSTTISTWWLRSADSNSSSVFYVVFNDGDWCYYDASGTSGVSPAFRIGNAS